MIRPHYTLRSVTRALIAGLGDGSIVLDQEATSLAPPIGTRIRKVHTVDRFGVVVGPVLKSPLDGGPRVKVRWERTGFTNAWDPVFLQPADSRPEDDPEVVRSGTYVRCRRWFDER